MAEIKLGSFASIWKKDQSTDLESGKKSSHKEGAHGGKVTISKLAVNVTSAHC